MRGWIFCSRETKGGISREDYLGLSRKDRTVLHEQLNIILEEIDAEYKKVQKG